MEAYWISNVKKEEGRGRVIYINPLPEKICTFDCVFCSLGRSKKTDQTLELPGTTEFIQHLETVLIAEEPDEVMIYPAGEALMNQQLSTVIRLIKSHGAKVGLLSNGYIYNQPAYRTILHQCDRVVGELMVVTEADFQKILRPLPGYTLAEHLANMEEFRREYQGQFTLSLNLLKGYSDSPEAIRILRGWIQRLRPDEVEVLTPEIGLLEIPKERLEQIRTDLMGGEK